jgi:hypothetical protein
MNGYVHFRICLDEFLLDSERFLKTFLEKIKMYISCQIHFPPNRVIDRIITTNIKTTETKEIIIYIFFLIFVIPVGVQIEDCSSRKQSVTANLLAVTDCLRKKPVSTCLM